MAYILAQSVQLCPTDGDADGISMKLLRYIVYFSAWRLLN